MAQAALLALDRYMETWNSRDPARWAASLHYPHIRPGPGPFELAADGAAVQRPASTSIGRWPLAGTTRNGRPGEVLQMGGRQSAYRRELGPATPLTACELTGSVITYIVTNQGGRWGVLSRFAAGRFRPRLGSGRHQWPAGRAQRAVGRGISKRGIRTIRRRWASSLHYPHVRIQGDGRRGTWLVAGRIPRGSGARPAADVVQTRFDRIEVVQVSENGVNVAVHLQPPQSLRSGGFPSTTPCPSPSGAMTSGRFRPCRRIGYLGFTVQSSEFRFQIRVLQRC